MVYAAGENARGRLLKRRRVRRWCLRVDCEFAGGFCSKNQDCQVGAFHLTRKVIHRGGAPAASNLRPAFRRLFAVTQPQTGRQRGKCQRRDDHPSRVEWHVPAIDGPDYKRALGQDRQPCRGHKPADAHRSGAEGRGEWQVHGPTVPLRARPRCASVVSLRAKLAAEGRAGTPTAYLGPCRWRVRVCKTNLRLGAEGREGHRKRRLRSGRVNSGCIVAARADAISNVGWMRSVNSAARSPIAQPRMAAATRLRNEIGSRRRSASMDWWSSLRARRVGPRMERSFSDGTRAPLGRRVRCSIRLGMPRRLAFGHDSRTDLRKTPMALRQSGPISNGCD